MVGFALCMCQCGHNLVDPNDKEGGVRTKTKYQYGMYQVWGGERTYTV